MAVFRSGFFRKNDGSAIVEFALVAPLFFLLVFAMLEFGLYLYSKVIIENIALEVTRTASLGKSSDAECPGTTNTVAYIECIVPKRASVLINGDKTQVQIMDLAKATTVIPDICFDTDPPSSPQTCTGTYEEVNNIPDYQGTDSSNSGTAGSIIQVRISYPWSVQMPLVGKFFQKTDSQGNNRNVVMITASTVIKNEPFPVATSR